MIRILLVDDHPLLRRGVAEIINASPDLTVVAEAGSTLEAIAQLEAVQPDLVLLDIHLKGGSGLEIVPEMRRRRPGVRILVYTGHLSEPELRGARVAKVDGYVLKTSPAGELLTIVRNVATGGTFWASATAAMLASALERPTPSSREMEVLRLLAAGWTNKQIGASLGISIHTVIEHVLSVRAKLGARNRAEAVHRATQQGLL